MLVDTGKVGLLLYLNHTWFSTPSITMALAYHLSCAFYLVKPTHLHKGVIIIARPVRI